MHPWPLQGLDDTLVDKLIIDFKNQGIPDDLLKKLFSRDVNRNIEAALFIQENLATAHEISDLLIKWTYLMLYE